MKSWLSGMVVFFFALNAHAACPSIEGEWAMTFDEVWYGYQLAGIGRATVTADKIKLRLREGQLGTSYIATFTGNYSVQANCMLTWNYAEQGGTSGGTVHGIIVSANKLFLMFSNPNVQSTGTMLAERIEY